MSDLRTTILACQRHVRKTVAPSLPCRAVVTAVSPRACQSKLPADHDHDGAAEYAKAREKPD